MLYAREPEGWLTGIDQNKKAAFLQHDGNIMNRNKAPGTNEICPVPGNGIFWGRDKLT